MPPKRKVITANMIKRSAKKTTDRDGIQGAVNEELLTKKPKKEFVVKKDIQGVVKKSRSRILQDINKSLMTGGRVKIIN